MTASNCRILTIAPTPYFSDRGCHVRIYEEARFLHARGHEVVICTYHLGRQVPPVPVVRIPRIPWYRKETAGPSWQKPFLDLLLMWQCVKVIRRNKINIIHAHLHEGAFIGFFLKKLFRLPMVFDCQGSLSGELLDHHFFPRKSLRHRFFLSLEKMINSWADHILTSSTPTAHLLVDEFGLSAEKVSAAVDGVDTDIFRPGLETTDLAQSLGLPQGKCIVVFLGAMAEHQGIDKLLESIRVLKNYPHRMHFLLMGYPEEAYVTLASKLGISEYITFTGKVDYSRAAEYLCLGDIAVTPKISATEANGKIYNYMACGLPTVVFDLPVSREILAQTGIYAKFADVEDLAEKLYALSNDPEQIKVLSEQVRQRAVDKLSWEQTGSLVEGVLTQLVNPSV